MEPTIYNISNYQNLRRDSKREIIPEIISFPKERVHWKNYFEQTSGVEQITVTGPRSSEFRASGTRVPLTDFGAPINLSTATVIMERCFIQK